MQAIQAAADQKDVSPSAVADFVTLGPLGTALLPSNWPKALLIDEIDKADLDLPNDLLNAFEEGRFTMEELRRETTSVGSGSVRTYKGTYGTREVNGGSVACTVFPFVVLTSNGEREFSAPFLRRCVRLDLKPPDKGTLVRIVKAHLGDALSETLEEEAQAFLDKRGDGKLSTDQLLNAVYLLDHTGFDGADKKALLELLYRELM